MTSAAPGVQAPLVLVVDDSDKNRKLARDVLGAAGFRTVEAASGAECLTIAAEHLPDVVLLDLRLPDMDGTEVVRALRDAPRTARLAIVALTALRGADCGSSLAGGFDGFLEKPISVRAFPDQVRRYCKPAAE